MLRLMATKIQSVVEHFSLHQAASPAEGVLVRVENVPHSPKVAARVRITVTAPSSAQVVLYVQTKDTIEQFELRERSGSFSCEYFPQRGKEYDTFAEVKYRKMVGTPFNTHRFS